MKKTIIHGLHVTHIDGYLRALSEREAVAGSDSVRLSG